MRSLFLTGCILLSSLFAKSQGCSDAGACSIETFEFDENTHAPDQKIKLNYDQTIGLGEKFIFISQSTLGIQYRLMSTGTRFEIRVPFIFTFGNLGHTSGVGDLILSVSQDIFKDKAFQWTALIGGRLKTNNSDFSYDDLPLPMAYQTSLGTNDIILGTQYARSLWSLYFAYQHPFGINNNTYLVPKEETDPNKQYYESAYLNRGDDLYLRAQYYLTLRKENGLLFNLLGIYRIQQSEILKNDKRVKLDGSSGFTLNIGITYQKQLKKNREFSLILAFPVIDKDYRADGLTRNIVIGLSFRNL
ncbi:MAG: hypothetical protein V2I62_11645 [Bacteroidales bacterium]|jgi:hypothetical protein|nr:hypothetical protein [Bacteroidales bacterium]